MAKAKTKAKAAAKKAPAKAKTKPAAKPTTKTKTTTTTTTSKPSGERVELAMLAGRAALTDRMRDAFRSQCTDARAEQLGGETKSALVLSEARKWCVIVDHVLTHLRPGQVIRYSADRLTFFLECVSELADTIASEGGRAVAAGAAAGSAAVAEQRVRAVRNDLVLALTEIADGNQALETELSVARGESDTPSTVLDSLRSLADLGTKWATSFDPTLHALTQSVGLTRDDMSAATAAADALAGALGGKTTSVARRGSDSVAVNRIEGRVVFEMGKAMAPFNDAAARGIGQTLTPGPATARVLASQSRRAKDKKPAPAAGAPASA